MAMSWASCNLFRIGYKCKVTDPNRDWHVQEVIFYLKKKERLVYSEMHSMVFYITFFPLNTGDWEHSKSQSCRSFFLPPVATILFLKGETRIQDRFSPELSAWISIWSLDLNFQSFTSPFSEAVIMDLWKNSSNYLRRVFKSRSIVPMKLAHST